MGAAALLVVVVVLGFVLIAPSTKARTASDNTPSSPSRFTSFRKWCAANSQKWLKVVFAGGVILLLLYFWDRINVPVAMWLSDSIVGTKFNLEASFIAQWLWVPAVLVVMYILWRIFRNRSTAANAGSSFSFEGFFNGIIDLIVGTIFIGIIAFGVVLIGGIIIQVAGIDDTVVDIINATTGTKKVKCVTSDELSSIRRFDRGGRDIIVCSTQAGRTFYAYPIPGYQLKVEVSPNFENKHLMEGRAVPDFVEVNAPGAYKHSTPHAWQIVVKKGEVWQSSGLDHIKLHISAVK